MCSQLSSFPSSLAINPATAGAAAMLARAPWGGSSIIAKTGTDTEVGKSNGGWLEAVVENGSQPRVPAGGGLRIYFAGGAYCQISGIGQAALALR